MAAIKATQTRSGVKQPTESRLRRAGLPSAGLDEAYDAASGGVLSDPSGYGADADAQRKAAGIIGSGESKDGWRDDEGDDAQNKKKPCVSGALSELHHAVTDKLQSWNPYHPGPSSKPLGGSKANNTTAGKGKKKPTDTSVAALLGEDVKEGFDEADRLGARTRIGKCTILFNGNSYWERAIRTHEQHDRMQGYRLHVLRQSLLDDVWSKPAYILSLLLRELSKPEGERLEWLFWVDADTIILNPHMPIETFLPPPGSEFDDVHLMYSNDWNGLNNGVFPVRVNQWSVELFSAIVSFRHYRPDDPLLFRDQSAMNRLMEEPKFAKSIVEAPQRWFNAYQGEHNETLQPYQIRRGDLLVHFAGVPGREERMGYWLDRAEQHLDDWEIPVKSTSYPQEAKDYWAAQRDARKNHRASLTETRLTATTLLDKVEKQLNDYGVRLTPEQLESINAQQERLKNIIEDARWEEKVLEVTEATNSLTEATFPLTLAMNKAHKMLLSSAHEAIFAGEKDLLDGGFNVGLSTPELKRISETVKTLKNLVMSPQDFWNRQDITTATNAVTVARARVQESVAAPLAETAAAQAAAVKIAQASAGRAKALADARMMAQAEAAQAAAQAVAPAEANQAAAQVVTQVEVVTIVPVATVAAQAAPVKITQANAERAKALADARMMAQAEADQAAAQAVAPAEANQAAAQDVTQAEVVTDVPVATVSGHVITVTPEAVMVWTTAAVAADEVAHETAAGY
ncbi:hypothetical protein LTR08_002958 [Meristemomyces frigidus]|nr:hypothetical protein LTR08_002958 [Meristemomyces frigidus]